MRPLPELLLQTPKRNFRALANPPLRGKPARSCIARHTADRSEPSDVRLNESEGLRAAYYVEWDPASYSSLKQHIRQIDLLFPEWLHVVRPDGT